MRLVLPAATLFAFFVHWALLGLVCPAFAWLFVFFVFLLDSSCASRGACCLPFFCYAPFGLCGCRLWCPGCWRLPRCCYSPALGCLVFFLFYLGEPLCLWFSVVLARGALGQRGRNCGHHQWHAKAEHEHKNIRDTKAPTLLRTKNTTRIVWHTKHKNSPPST